MARPCGVPCGSCGKMERMCRKRERRVGSVGKGEERAGGCGTEASLKEPTGRQGVRKGRGGAGGKAGFHT